MAKRATPYNVVIGGRLRMTADVGFGAATGSLAIEPCVSRPPALDRLAHAWALRVHVRRLARGHTDASVLTGRAKRGNESSTRRSAPVSLLPWALGFTGPIYGVAAIAAGVHMIALAWRLRTDGRTGERAAKRLFAFSIAYLFSLFAAYLAQKELTLYFAFALQ